MRRSLNKHLLLVGIALATLGADQATKYLAVSRLTSAFAQQQGVKDRLNTFLGAPPAGMQSQSYDVLPSYFGFRYVENRGAAWGLMADLPRRVREPFLHVASLLALGFIAWMFRRLEPGQRLLQISLSLVVGGALGNLMDRVLRGYVIDFIDWHWRDNPGLRWPTFNVADSAICVGVTLMLLDSLRPRPAGSASVLDTPGLT